MRCHTHCLERKWVHWHHSVSLKHPVKCRCFSHKSGLMQPKHFKIQIPRKWSCFPNKEMPVPEAEAGLGSPLCPVLCISLVENWNVLYWLNRGERSELSSPLSGRVTALWDTCFSFCLFGVTVQWLGLQWRKQKPTGCPRYFLEELKPLLPRLWCFVFWAGAGKDSHSCREGVGYRTAKLPWHQGFVDRGQPGELKQAKD